MPVLQVVPMETFFGWLNSQADGATDTVQVLFILAITVVVGVVCLRSRGAIAAILGAMLTAGLAYWLIVGDGIAFIGKLLQSQAGG